MIPVANTANTNTWDYFITRVNEIANHMTKAVVTSDGSGNTNVTTGNVIISGAFRANTVSVGNTSSNIYITCPNTEAISNGQFFLNANGSWTSPTILQNIYRNTITTSGISTQNIDSFPIASFTSAEYLINAKDNVANNKYVTKVLVMHDGGSAHSTEYATIISNTSICTFSVTQNTSHIILRVSPGTSSISMSYLRITI